MFWKISISFTSILTFFGVFSSEKCFYCSRTSSHFCFYHLQKDLDTFHVSFFGVFLCFFLLQMVSQLIIFLKKSQLSEMAQLGKTGILADQFGILNLLSQFHVINSIVNSVRIYIKKN